ncbi:MAG TPA: MASE1 domain-containing protein [Gemmatimonadales bacterium]|nr:MASE1 domain-containing protein [Gemmatimonadales bacterium]
MPTAPTQDLDLLVTPRTTLHPAEGRPGWPILITAWLAVLFGQWGSVLLWVPPSQQSTIWLPGGLLLAILVLTEARLWPLVLLAAGAGQATLFMSLDLLTPAISLVMAIELTLVVATTAWALKRVVEQPVSLGTFREFVTYLGVVVLGGALLASVVFLAGAHLLHYRPATFLVWRAFGLSVLLSYLMVTPAVVLLVRNIDRLLADTPARRLEGLMLTLLMTLASGIVFGGATGREYLWPLFAVVIPPLLFWAAGRFGPLGAAGSVLLVTLISTYGTARGLGPFNFETAAKNTLTLQVFMLGTAPPLMGLAVILAEQNRTMGILRQTHERLRDLNRDLLAARETEAGRIARELHDDIGQRLALVSIGLSHLRKVVRPAETGPLGEIAKLQEQTSSISKSLRELSHQLHPTALQHTGLAVALQMACDEVSRITGLDVQLVADGDSATLPGEVALCLFRVAQEGLSNAVRHARADTIRMSLRRRNGDVMLLIDDNGVGFVPGSPHTRSGLGLHSMLQRLSLVGGILTIDSAPGTGTRIRAQVVLNGAPSA